MSLSLAIQQITAPNWWNDPVQPWKSNRKRLNEIAQLRQKFIAGFALKRKPSTMQELAKQHDCTVARIRALADPFIKSGRLIRGVNSDGLVTLEKGDKS